MSDLFSDAARERLPDGRAARAAAAPAVARRVRRPGARARRGLGAPARDRGGPGPLDDPLRAAGHRQDDARADRRARRPAPTSRSSPRSRRRSRRCARCSPARASGSAATGRRTILFLDEIHRFNKAQQDALLPAVEEGLVTLIGATTENPYFEVNSALLSRAQVYELEPLSSEDLATVVAARRRGARRRARRTTCVDLIARRAGGDARNALNILELAVQTAQAEGEPLAEAHVEDAARKRPLVYDKGGDAHYDFISAFIKSMRGSDPDASRLLPRGDARGRRGRRASSRGG